SRFSHWSTNIFASWNLPTSPSCLIGRRSTSPAADSTRLALASCSCVCRRLHQLCNHDPMWKVQCHKYWLVSEEEKAEKKLSWKEMFCEYFSDLGRYIEHYAEVRTAWEELKAFLEVQCPRMIASLKGNHRVLCCKHL
uniref:F-box domain-containing protein n=1 Tax=Callorhinchus milii TaxID=7868 RepID=A0A4W3GPD9_CALMI